MLWQLTFCLGCIGIYFSLYVLCCKTDFLSDTFLASLVCIIPYVDGCVKILEAESETCNILLLVMKIMCDDWRIILWYLLEVWECEHFFKKDFNCEDWRKGCVSYLSVLTGVGWICFSQKFAKGGDCWIFVCWLHFCLKQIFNSDVEHNVQHPDLVCTFCALPMFTHALA
jgi:hypothetical protein